MQLSSHASALRNVLLVATMFAIALTVAQQVGSAPKKPYKRARPDTSKDDTADIFFDDIFTEGLRGERPANLRSGAPSVRPPVRPSGGGSDPSPMPMGGGKWDAIVSAQTLEDEVKRIKLEIDKDVTTPTAFNGLGHKKCRKNFSLLGMTFAIIGQYGGDVRWKDDAAAARDMFGRAGRNCKAATPASYNESKLRKQDLADMVAGSRLQADGGSDEFNDWSQVCERSQLMKRVESALGRLRQLTASAGEFKSNQDEARHEAEMLAAIAQTLLQDGMPDDGDDDYAAYCETLKKSGQAIVDAAKQGSVDAVGPAMGNITRACDQCHEVYRG